MEKFRFPVVYASGKISYEKLEGETFFGIICGDVLITARDAPKKMNYVQALAYAKSKQLRGKQGQMFNNREVDIIFQHFDEVNDILSAFNNEGVQPLSHGCYWLMLGDNNQIADMGVKSIIRGVSGTGEYYVRPVFSYYSQLGKICPNHI